MKKTTLLFTFLFLLICQHGFAQTAIQPAGEGTFESPYLIENLGNLYWLSQNPAEWTKRFYQTNNIDAASTATWDDGAGFSPIGNSTTQFSGFYNGQGFAISNLHINRPASDDVGLFGKLYLAYIRNLFLPNVTVVGANCVGALVGDTYNLSDILNCGANGIVTGVNEVGGLVGNCMQTVISNCGSKGTVNSTGIAAGGLVGRSRFGSDINNCFSRSEVIGNDIVGGLVGENLYENSQMINIVNCYSTGHVSGNSQIGALVGVNNGDVINSFFDYVTSGLYTSAGGVGYDTEAMKDQAIYLNVNWDLYFVWGFNSSQNDGYPYLRAPINPPAEAPQAGDGTMENPFQISSLENLVWLSRSPVHWDKHFIQTADINLLPFHTEGWNWSYDFSPIGNQKQSFSGKYNGQGFTIDNLMIEREIWSNIGLFGYVQSADIRNLNLTNAHVGGKKSTGILVGQAVGETAIYNCHVSGEVIGLWKEIGGVVGTSYSYVWECSSLANVNGLTSVGGLVGQTIGMAYIFGSFSTGTVEGFGNVGGLVGANQQSQIVQCHSSGSVIGESVIGGLVGLNASNSLVSNCYANGSVTTTDYGGGLIGRCLSSGNVINSYSVGLVSGTSSLGGMIGVSNTSTIANSFWDTETSGQSISGGGTGKTTAQMKDVATFTNLTTEGLTEPWDLVYNPNDDVANENIWNIKEGYNNGYPFFNWQCSIPTLDWQPETEEACVGGVATFSFSVASATEVDYQWQIKTDGEFEDIADANSFELVFADVMQVHNGVLFRCIATNECGFLVSNEVELIVLESTQLVIEPESQTPCAGETVEFTVEATGSYLSYEWYKNDVLITDIGNSPILTLLDVTEEDNGNYRCVVTGDCSSVESQEVTLTVITLTPIVDMNFGDITGPSLKVNIEGAEYQWYYCPWDCEGLIELEGAVSQIIGNLSDGYYAVLVTLNGCSVMSNCYYWVHGSVTSNSINNLSLFPNPTNDKVTIGNLNGAMGVLRISNVMGKTIAELKVEGEGQIVDISAYPKGAYIFEIVYENQTLRGRVIKN